MEGSNQGKTWSPKSLVLQAVQIPSWCSVGLWKSSDGGIPSLFQIAREPNSSISRNKADITWNYYSDWEIEEVINLFSRLEGQVINVQEADKLKWGSDTDGKYSVKAGYANSYAPNELLGNRSRS
ncbi:hypothetical protein MTR67_029776 [Solanum verrucosum]|uniref:Uncharacterized protein n=1 Tax=Solanum verrucosum TaxID=315347 RepID=A0AAF0R6I5_SOLVR|nr:hypothetical protein MTR67_029776 [Solanum verrucosum]